VNWEAISAIGEIVGAMGVIISLLYLAAQVRQNTQVARAATRQAIASDLQGLASDLVTGDDAARLFHAHISGQKIEPYQNVRLQARAYRDFHFWDNAHYQFCEGMLSAEEWRGIRENLKQLVVYVPAYREYWDGEQSSFSTRFRTEVSQLLAEDYAGRGSTVLEALGAEAPDSGESSAG
jgi:hypothetical protein